jgi:DNA-directed RNA polymerase subunit RPC12/RpoP
MSCEHDYTLLTTNKYVCIQCGIITTSYENLVKHHPIDETIGNGTIEKRCVHVWICLGDRVHNRSNKKNEGNYQAYKCRECGKFKRRAVGKNKNKNKIFN